MHGSCLQAFLLAVCKTCLLILLLLCRLHALVQDKVDAMYKDKAKWTRMSIMMTAGAGKFSTDRTIAEYAKDIWDVKPCVVPQPDS
jgi:glucan phosphorylase